jgi:hypothetical protein
MLLFTGVQAGAAPIPKGAAPGVARASAASLRPATSIPGAQKIVKNKKVIYRIPGPVRVSNRHLTVGSAPVAAKASVKSISLSPMESLMGLDTTYNISSKYQPLLLGINPLGTFQLTKSDLDAVEISYPDNGVFDLASDDDEYLYLMALKTGSATVTVKVAGKKASKTFTVRDKVNFTSMSIGELRGTSESNYKNATLKSKTMYANESATILAQPRPFTATYYDYPYYEYYGYCTSAVTFTSSNEKVASVSPFGDLYAKYPGKAKITATARDGSKKKYTISLTVKPKAPQNMTLYSAGSAKLAPGTTQQVYAIFTPVDYYNQKVTWTSNNPAIAKVDANGLVTAVSAGSTGTAVATITAKSGNLTRNLAITVTYNKALTGAAYRFYGIGNSAYPTNPLAASVNDLNAMADAARDAGFANVYTALNQTGDGIEGVLESMAGNSAIDEDDVTVFYYSGRGVSIDSQFYRGALYGTDEAAIPVDMVQYYLDQVPGTVVVILDSAMSGQYITSKSASPAKALAASKAYANAWISKLSSSKATNFTSKALAASYVKSKYKILVACEPLETAYRDDAASGFGWFTKWVAKGIGRVPNLTTGGSAAGALVADANHDKVVSLDELYDYVSLNLPLDTEYKWWDAVIQQHTQVWPANDNFPVVNKFGS